MNTVYLQIDFLSFWHVGSGMGRGGDVDALVLRDENGLPFLPGRSVKGLLREAFALCEETRRIEEGTVDWLFGRSADSDHKSSLAGCLRVTNAVLDPHLRAWLSDSDGSDCRDFLFETVASTAIDEQGIAKSKTLRKVEVCIPLQLRARLSAPSDIHLDVLCERVVAFIRAAGAQRHRGLGRCEVRVIKEGALA